MLEQIGQTPRETAELVYFDQWHEDWQIPNAEWIISRLETLRATPWIWDVAHVHPSWLPILAVWLHADAYIAGIYNEEYERRIILGAAIPNRLRGKPGAIDRFAVAAQFLWDFRYVFDGIRVSGIDLFLTPSVGAGQTDREWQRYVTRVCTAFVPLWIQIGQIFIAQRFSHETRIVAGYEAHDWEITADGLSTTINLL